MDLSGENVVYCESAALSKAALRFKEIFVSVIYDPVTGIDIGDPATLPLDADHLPSRQEIAEAASPLILSASGWRKVFASARQGDTYASWTSDKTAENSLSPHISPADRVVAALMAHCFGNFLVRRKATGGASGKSGGAGISGAPKDSAAHEGPDAPRILLGIDSRPTGPAIADVFARVLIGMGIDVRYCFIVAAPEIMAFAGSRRGLEAAAAPGDGGADFKSGFDNGYAAGGEDSVRGEDSAPGIDGFAYISASHNPPGHNGVKFGLDTGGVLSAAQIAPLIDEFKASLSAEDPADEAYRLIAAAESKKIAECFQACTRWKRFAFSAYTLFMHRLVTGETSLAAQGAYLDQLALACAGRPLGIVAELNGSARSLSIDKDFFEGLSIRNDFHNAQPRQFVHRIVPEGDSLALCARLLRQAREKDPAYQLGYVPDCDGDRGNLVFYDKKRQKARALEAQEVFALSCLAELSGLYRGGPGAKNQKVAVVVNDATSMRIERIASFFGARVFRAETGEANVVNLAEKLKAQGWILCVLGEGSNGGTITPPSRVRDPLSTLGSMIRLLRLPDTESGPSLFRLWLDVCGKKDAYWQEYDLSDVIATLPAWATTSVFEERAALRVKTADKTELKRRYRDVFAAEWARRAGELQQRFSLVSWKAFATQGIEEREIGGDFAASGSGGLRIVFSTARGEARAFLWMRGSGTEPVFRIMADVEGGSPADEEYLLAWHSAMVNAADEASR